MPLFLLPITTTVVCLYEKHPGGGALASEQFGQPSPAATSVDGQEEEQEQRDEKKKEIPRATVWWWCTPLFADD